MSDTRYPEETLDPDDDNGTMPDNVDILAQAVVGHRIVSAGYEDVKLKHNYWGHGQPFVITLDNGTKVALRHTSDCCAYTALEKFLLHPDKIDHVIMGVGTTGGYSTWHIYADWGDVLALEVGWSSGNPFYYGYGFDIDVISVPS